MTYKPKNKVFDCYCGHEWYSTREDNEGIGYVSYRIDQCPICYRLHQIRIGSSALKHGLRCETYDMEKGWVPGDYSRANIIERVATAHYFNVKVLGSTLANMMLEKAVGDYWNEVKGYWKFGSRPEWFCPQQ